MTALRLKFVTARKSIGAMQRAIQVQRLGLPSPQRSRRCFRQRCRAVMKNGLDDWSGKQFTLLSTSEEATAALASTLAIDLRAGDAYCLKGDEGAGKSTFCRAFIRAAANDPSLTVNSPPQSLQPYVYNGQGELSPTVLGDLPILHFDLGGLQRPSQAECDQLAAEFGGAVSLIEWAERLKDWGAAPEQRLALYFRRLPADAVGDAQDSPARLITVVPHTALWESRASLLYANLAAAGVEKGLVMLSVEMASSLTAGLPESLVLAGADTKAMV